MHLSISQQLPNSCNFTLKFLRIRRIFKNQVRSLLDDNLGILNFQLRIRFHLKETFRIVRSQFNHKGRLIDREHLTYLFNLINLEYPEVLRHNLTQHIYHLFFKFLKE
jgi:hypothetical protein